MAESLQQFDSRHWDAIVVGTGMGGATIGHALAKAGQSVLFCEQGRTAPLNDALARGDYSEMLLQRGDSFPDMLRRGGRAVDEIADMSGRRSRAFVPFLGSGLGGSSALYGMALERFFPSDFTPRRNHAGAIDSTLPESWPIDFEELEPYYRTAEGLYRVRAGDLLDGTLTGAARDSGGSSGQPLSGATRELAGFLVDRQMHPYRLPLACEFVPGCRGCQGYLCATPCKNDSARMCLAPALSQHGAALLDDCIVTRILAERDTVTGVVCRRHGVERVLRGKRVILAAGALATPALLLASSNEHWPAGLANRSGMVGRNLMRHCVDLYAIFTRNRPSLQANTKEVAFNDFYDAADGKLGSVQSFGPLPPADMLVDELQRDLAESAGRWASKSFSLVKPVVRPILGALLSRALVLASVMEDLPYADNRVTLQKLQGNEVRTAIHYRLHQHELERVALFRRKMRKVLTGYRFLLFKQAANNQRLAHVCGTCRFGTDPATSVLDAHNRAHGIDNLFVVDASFFPSSGGINPSLTIAANALRVADFLIAQ